MRSALITAALAGLVAGGLASAFNPWRLAEQALDGHGYIQLGALRPVAWGCSGPMRRGFSFAAISGSGGVIGGKVCVGGFRAPVVAEVPR